METFTKAHTKTCGIEWYKNINTSGGAQDYVISNCKDDEVPICRVAPKQARWWGAISYKKLSKAITKNHYLYEILPLDIKKKVYFDIDKTIKINEDTDVLGLCKEKISKYFPNCHMQISGSSFEYIENEVEMKKISYHIVLSNYFMSSNESLLVKAFTIKYKELGFDTCVYSKNRLMKIINQSKPDGRIQAYVEGSLELSKHLICHEFDEDAQSIAVLNLQFDDIDINTKDRFKIDILQLPDFDYPNPEDFNYVKSSALEKLLLIPNNKHTITHNISWKLCIWARDHEITFTDFWNWCKMKEDSPQRMKKFYEYYYGVKYADFHIKYDTIKFILKKFYPNILELPYIKQFKKQFNLDNKIIIDRQFLQCSDISNVETKYIIPNTPMGSNKTGSVIEFIETYPIGTRVLWITPRITLSKNVYQRLGAQFEYYKDYTKAQKENGDLSVPDRILCSLESLHYLRIDDMYKYDIVIIDEIETVLNTLNSSASTHKYLDLNWSIFKDTLKQSNKVILMDAFTTKLTTNLVNTLEGIGNYTVIESTVKPQHREFKITSSFYKWLDDLKKAVQAGKKLFIFTPFKSGERGVVKIAEFLKQYIGENETILSYHAETARNKKKLIDVDNVWGNPLVKIVVTNGTISVGVNFNEADIFDEIHGYYNPMLNPRDFIQAMYRVRHPRSNVMKLYIESYSRFDSNYEINPKEKNIKCSVYDQLKKDLDIEFYSYAEYRNKKGFKNDTFFHFCEKANITCVEDSKVISRKIAKLLREELDKCDVYFRWSKIDDITEEQARDYECIIASNRDRLKHHLQLAKYNFKMLFKNGTDDKKLEAYWDKNEQFFFKKAAYMFSNPIIKAIFKDNDVAFGDDLVKPILTSVTIEDINRFFNFHNPITKINQYNINKILSSFFHKPYQVCTKDSSNHYKWTIDIKTIERCEFWKHNSRYPQSIDDEFFDDYAIIDD
jgi:hypothetical protein